MMAKTHSESLESSEVCSLLVCPLLGQLPQACWAFLPSISLAHHLFVSSSLHILCIHHPLSSDALQQMIKSLKKAMAPVLSDVTVEWVFPETTEVLISPVSTSSLFPGERLMGYGIVCDASLYMSNSSPVSTSDMWETVCGAASWPLSKCLIAAGFKGVTNSMPKVAK